MKVYFNPKCSKCIAAEDFLKKHGKKFEKFHYLEKPMTKENIKEILEKGNLKIDEILRKGEKEYSEYIDGKNLSEDEIIDAVIEHPILLQRPIIISDKSAIIARDSESLDKVLKASYEDFAKLDIRVGKILKAEDHPNADKLYVLTVDLGFETRTIVAGLKRNYKKEELEGKKAVFIANLEPAKLRGIESNGMILAAANSDESTISFLQPEKDIEEGSKIR